MKMEVTITGRYEIPDNPDERDQIYGDRDPSECARFDKEELTEFELLEACDEDSVTVQIVPLGFW